MNPNPRRARGAELAFQGWLPEALRLAVPAADRIERFRAPAVVEAFGCGRNPVEKRRIVVTKGSSDDRDGMFLPYAGRNEQIELASDLAGALQSCLDAPCERLYVSLFQADPAELTSLAMFRAMKPSQHVVLVVDPSIRALVEGMHLADECLTFEN
jgi:hypothetical protein